jgi:hypothetical protein
MCYGALFTRHAKRMSLIILQLSFCLAVPYISTLSHNGHDLKESYGKKVMERKLWKES